ncbi:hypothetical protein CF327_g2319 [Tilletia walkeri]|uniref:glucan 1,3-beta-glucosidase n=1 Tax=Tilletia walkeri TaxID=117179 RepID=A0A8X7N8L6_9BASI|nr:hypothetical protein CF327_g2319 [Tilletia walkeri]KAE8267630.1 hypothetical protein A4X09_0g4713 [Tilletia walkeri]
MDYPSQQQQQGQPQMQQYQQHQDLDQGGGFYTQPLAYRSSGHLGQPDSSSIKSTTDFYSPSGSPRPSFNQHRDLQNGPYSANSSSAMVNAQGQQYYQDPNSQGHYGALQHDLGERRGAGEAGSIAGASGYGQARSSTASLISERATTPGGPAYRNAQPAQGSALRNAFPMTAEGAQSNTSGAIAGSGLAAPSGTGYRPVIKGGISEKKTFQQRQPWFIRFFLLFMLCAVGGGVFALVKFLQDKAKGAGYVPYSAPGGAGTVSTYFKLPAWNFTDPSSKAFGVNLGNFLVLERWLDEDTFVSMCGADVFDEYHCAKSLGNAQAVTALQNHYNTFIAESDIDTMQRVGVNVVRITLGFWALIPTLANEPYVDAGQMDQLKKVLGWLNTRRMRAIISLHGLPGSQSGDQSTGQFRNQSHGASWFSADNQQRSVATVQALSNWITALTPELASTISAVLPVNEPDQRHNDDGTFAQTLQNFYTQSYAILSKINMVMALHSGQGPSSYPPAWNSWLSDKDPNTIFWEAHPYPGWFPTRTSKHAIYKRICDVTQLAAQLPNNIPVFVGEFSVLSGITEAGWVDSYWQTQLAAYSQSAGSTFWTWKANNSTTPVVALPGNEMANYNFQGLIEQGTILTPPRGRTIATYLSLLPNNACSLAASTAPAAGGGSGDGSGSDTGDDDAGNPTSVPQTGRRGVIGRSDVVATPGRLRRRSMV